MKSALVTGASGFIGQALVKRLLKLGIHTICLVRSKALANLPADAEIIEVPNLNSESIPVALKTCKADVIFNLASYGVKPQDNDPNMMLQVNISNVTALLSAVKDWHIEQFINIGSCAEYGDVNNMNYIDETASLQPLSIYGASKVAAYYFAAALARRYQLPFTHLRLFGIYGSGEAKHRLAPNVIQHLHRNQAVALSPGTQIRDFLYIDDLIDALMNTVKLPANNSIYNICSGTATSVKDFALIIADLLNKDPALLQFGKTPMRDQEVMRLVGNNQHFVQQTNWKPTISLRQGLTNMITQYEQT